jgi:hypothetical protein
VCVLQCLEESGLDKSQLTEVEIVGESHKVTHMNVLDFCTADLLDGVELILMAVLTKDF